MFQATFTLDTGIAAFYNTGPNDMWKRGKTESNGFRGHKSVNGLTGTRVGSKGSKHDGVGTIAKELARKKTHGFQAGIQLNPLAPENNRGTTYLHDQAAAALWDIFSHG